jgi:pyridinium-3,5-bisthiocarboxylic acid mononucleotide nickel chelatase
LGTYKYFSNKTYLVSNMDMTSRVLVLDPFSGASGDMFIGSLLGLGANKKLVKEAMESAADVTVSISEVKQGLLSAIKVEVIQHSDTRQTYARMVEQIESAGLPGHVEPDVLGILELMGNAESRVHGTPLDELHLHEMGQQDAVADIVGAVSAFHNLELPRSRVLCMPVSVGGGYVDTAHGLLPVPAPATLSILDSSNLVWRGGPVEHELLTPTGAAILAYLVKKYGSTCPEYPLMTSSVTGYGAGSRDTGMPNVLRSVLGELDAGLAIDHVEMLETNVDDVTGEIVGYLIQELMDDGALDVSVIPATMKKGRSGFLIKVVCRSEDTNRLAYKIIAVTGSLGVRLIPVRHRLTALRRMMDIEIQAAGRPYQIPVKVGCDNKGNWINISAEFEDCRRIAQKTGLQVKDLMRRAEEAARIHLDTE